MNSLESIVKQLEIRCSETLAKHEQACRDHGEANRLYVKQLELEEQIELSRIAQESLNVDVARLMSEIHWTELIPIPAIEDRVSLPSEGKVTWNGVKYDVKEGDTINPIIDGQCIVQTAAGLEIGTPVKKPIGRPRKDAPQEAQTPSLAAVPGSNEPVGHIPSVKASVLAYALTRKCPVTLLLTDDVRKVLGPAGDGDVSEQFFDGDKAGIEEAAEEAEALAAVAGAKGLKGSVALLQEYQGKQIQLWAVTFAGKDHK